MIIAAGEPLQKNRRLNSTQVNFLKDAITANPYPDTSTKQEFACQLGLSLETIESWFRRERFKLRKDTHQKKVSLGELLMSILT